MSTPCRLYSGVWAMVHYAVNCFAMAASRVLDSEITILSPPLAKKRGGGVKKNFSARFARRICPPHFQNRGAAPAD